MIGFMISFNTRSDKLSKASQELSELMKVFEDKNKVQYIESLVPKPFPKYSDLDSERLARLKSLKNQCNYSEPYSANEL